MRSGRRKSFHIHIALITMTETVTGCSSGKITWKKARSGRHPSMAAHSSSSVGTVFTNPWYMKRESGTPSPQ